MRIRVLPAIIVVALLSGCTIGTAAPDPTAVQERLDEFVADLGALPGVIRVEPASDDHLIVTITTEVADDTLVASAREANALAAEAAWPGDVLFVRATELDPETDLTPPSPWQQLVFPGDPEAVDVALRELLAIESVPDVVSVSLAGWPSVVLGSLDTFATAFRTLSALPRFADGATYSFSGDRPVLIVVHIPERMSVESVEAVIRIAVEYPDAEVELQTLTTPGERWPELYVAGLTPAEVSAVDARLRAPALADADPEGYSIPFQLATAGPDGPVLTFGTFGDVPDTSS